MAGRQTGQGGTQIGLPTLDWKTCKCGCGLQFLNSGRGRSRLYYNDSHKKRGYRARLESQTEDDKISREMWRGMTKREVQAWAESTAGTETVSWAWYELERRSR